MWATVLKGNRNGFHVHKKYLKPTPITSWDVYLTAECQNFWPKCFCSTDRCYIELWTHVLVATPHSRVWRSLAMKGLTIYTAVLGDEVGTHSLAGASVTSLDAAPSAREVELGSRGRAEYWHRSTLLCITYSCEMKQWVLAKTSKTQH
jgi:hypothetical protein